jgi:hypothetical protein
MAWQLMRGWFCSLSLFQKSELELGSKNCPENSSTVNFVMLPLMMAANAPHLAWQHFSLPLLNYGLGDLGQPGAVFGQVQDFRHRKYFDAVGPRNARRPPEPARPAADSSAPRPFAPPSAGPAGVRQLVELLLIVAPMRHCLSREKW